MLQRLLPAGAIALLLVSPALAQQQEKTGIPLNYKPPPTPEEIEKQKAADKAYDTAVQKIPDKKASSDPWGNIRPTSPAQAKTSTSRSNSNSEWHFMLRRFRHSRAGCYKSAASRTCLNVRFADVAKW